MRTLLLAAAILFTVAASAQTIEGPARASADGQVIVRGNRITLLDLPVRPLTPDTGKALAALIDGHTLVCILMNKVGHGLWQGRCSLEDGRDVVQALQQTFNEP